LGLGDQTERFAVVILEALAMGAHPDGIQKLSHPLCCPVLQQLCIVAIGDLEEEEQEEQEEKEKEKKHEEVTKR